MQTTELYLLDFGSRLRLFRKQRKLRQSDMAEALGVTVSAYSNYENNYRNPNDEVLFAISDILGVDMHLLIFGTELPDPEFDFEFELSLTEVNTIDNRLSDLCDIYIKNLNELGRAEALKRIYELSQLDQYKK